MIRDAGLLDFIDAHATEILDRRPDLMTALIARNVEIKATVVAADERETGQRAHLNLRPHPRPRYRGPLRDPPRLRRSPWVWSRRCTWRRTAA